MATTWEENTERRLSVVEQKVDKLLDPEIGIYPKLDQLQRRLGSWAVGILTALTLNLTFMLILLAKGGS